MIVNDINIFINYSFDSLDSSPLLSKKETLSRDCEHDETPRWASQRYNHSLFQTVGSPSNSGTTCSNTNNQLLVSKPFLTAYNKNFTSPSLRYVHFLSCQSLVKDISFRSLSPNQLSLTDSCTDLTGNFDFTEQQHLRTNFPPYVPNDDQVFFVERRESKPEITIPPPRPPRHSKSLGHLPKFLDQEKGNKRRRSTSTCKSTHSLFECSQGCFNEDMNPSSQLVTITTGPMVI